MDFLPLTATLVWAFSAGAPADAPPCVNGDIVYYAAADKKLYALRRDYGERLWARRFKAPLTTTPLVVGDVVYQYVPFPEGRLYAFRAADGERQWRVPAGPGVITAAAGGGIVAVGRDSAAAFYDAATGKEVSRVAFGEEVVGAAFAGNGCFVIWTAAGVVAMVDAEEGQVLWQARAAVGAVFPYYADGRVYVATAAGELAAYQGTSGEEIWRFNMGEALIGPPAAIGGDLLAVGRRTVFIYDGDDGEISWRFAPGGNVVGATPFGEGVVSAAADGRVLFATPTASCQLVKLEDFAASAPVVAADCLLATDGRKRLNCYKLRW